MFPFISCNYFNIYTNNNKRLQRIKESKGFLVFDKKKKQPDKAKTDMVMQKPRTIIEMMPSENTDPNGSYTGVPENKYEKPVQDADDL